MSATFEPGDRVEHPDRPEWIGEVLSTRWFGDFEIVSVQWPCCRWASEHDATSLTKVEQVTR